MTHTPQVHQYPHESWDQAFHRRAAENLAQIDKAIKVIGEIKDRDRKLGEEMITAFLTFSTSHKGATK